jgi:DNA repair exonuclease SbcCD nuclease subunit
MLKLAVRAAEADPGKKVLMLHAGVWDFGLIDIGKVRTEDVMGLKGTFDYVALGHAHNRHVIDGFVFNPGSLENVNLGEERQDKGFFVVRFDGERFEVETVELPRRPVITMRVDAGGAASPEEVMQRVREAFLEASPGVAMAKGADRPRGPFAPVVSLTLVGETLFHSYELDMEQVRREVLEILGGLYCRAENLSSLMRAVDEKYRGKGMDEIVREVLVEMVEEYPEWKGKGRDFAPRIQALKRMVLSEDCGDEEIADGLIEWWGGAA